MSEEIIEASEKEHKEKKKKTAYHLMLFVDNKDGGVHQMGIGGGFVRVILIIIACLVLVSVLGWIINSALRRSAQAKNEELQYQVDTLTANVEELLAENTDLSNKVSILSNTVNTKVEQETAIQEETDAAHFPEGFPLSSSASMSADEEDPKCLIFNCKEGTSIISSGAGTIIEVLPDADYGYCIRIDHENGYVTEYYMSASPLIKEGDAVLQGAILALVDKDKSKLAYKIYKDDKQIDPMTVIKIDG